MAGYVLHLSTEENITLSSATVKRLIAGGSGDAALLYLAILHARGAADSGKLARELKWDETRLRAAEQALYEMKLVGAPEKKEEAPLPPPQQLSEPPEYTREDIARKLEGDGRFACLLREVEHKLGPLSTPSVKKLLGLYENLGLPADVVYTLVNYCIAKKEQQFGEGRLPNMREIEKEGYVWARKELFSIEKASEYMKREQALRGRYPEYMAALQMQGRASAPSEEKYLSAWAEMGFPAETVAEAYDRRLMRQALARFDEDKQRRAENFRARERAVYTKCPRIEEIDRELSHTMAKIIASGLRRGTDPRPAIEALREENLNLQQEKRLLLTRLGLPGDYLEEKPKCSRCNDTGFLGSEVCSCLRGYYAKEQNKELSGLLDLGSQCFENFNFDYYSSVLDEDLGVSPRTNMERVYDICQDYAHEFSPKSGNLLLTGGTGLGKTFLSASIARVVSASGHSVVYDTAGHIFARFEAQKFGRDDGENADTAVSRALGCDLLILDDLGTELMTSFVHSAMYQIVNTRLITGKKTVISTNLSPDELGRRYGAPVLSRLQGEYQMLLFFGEDIRRQKRK